MPGGEPWFQIWPCSVTAFLTWIFEWHQYDSQPYKNHDNFSYAWEPLRRPHFSGTGLLKLPTRKVSLPAPQSTSKVIYWLAKDLAQMACNTTFSHYPVISTTKSHSLILWAHQLAEPAWRDNFGHQTWAESLKEQQRRTQGTTTTTGLPESRKTGMGSEMTKQVLVMSQELRASHRRKGAQHPAGEQHHSLVKGHKAVASLP